MGLFGKEGSSQSTKSDAPLRKSDRRKLRQSVEKEWWLGNTSNSEETVALLEDVFLGAGNILVRKLKLSNQRVVHPTVTVYYRAPSHTTNNGWPYSNTNMPIALHVEDGNKKSFYVPTVALLSVLSTTKLPSVIVPSIVSKYICRGADVMRSGVLDIQYPNNNKSSPLVCVYVKNNPQPFAIGFLTSNDFGPSTKGVAVEILTCYGDDLSKPYPQFDNDDDSSIINYRGGGANYGNGNYGNVGFSEGRFVYSLTTTTTDDDDDDDDGSSDEDETKEEQTNTANPSEDPKDGGSSTHESQEQQSTEDPNSLKLELMTVNDKNDVNSAGADNTAKEEAENTTREEEELSQDEILLQAFHNALLALKKTDLPMAVSTFYSKFVLPERPPNTTIHMKETTWQKFGSFLFYQQETSNIIKVKGNGTDPVATLVEVNRNHIDLRNAKQRRKEQQQKQHNHTKEADGKTRLAVVQLYIIQPHIANLLRLEDDIVKAVHAKSESRKGTGFLTAPECRTILETYVSTENLIQEDDPEYVTLDGPLTDILFRKKQRKNKKQTNHDDDNNNNKQATTEDIPSVITRKDLNSQWMDSLEKGFAFVQMPGSKIMTMKRGSPPMIQMEVEARTKKKFITRIRGLEEYFIDPSDFANDVSKRLACASSTEEITSSTKRKFTQVEFQGHIVEELTALLLGKENLSSHGGIKDSPYSVPKGVISVNLRKGVPGKKKK